MIRVSRKRLLSPFLPHPNQKTPGQDLGFMGLFEIHVHVHTLDIHKSEDYPSRFFYVLFRALCSCIYCTWEMVYLQISSIRETPVKADRGLDSVRGLSDHVTGAESPIEFPFLKVLANLSRR